MKSLMLSLLVLTSQISGMEYCTMLWKKYTQKSQAANPKAQSWSFEIKEEKGEVAAVGEMIYTTIHLAWIYAYANPDRKFVGWLKINQASPESWTIEDNNPLFTETPAERNAAKKELFAQAAAFARERNVKSLAYHINPEEIRECEDKGGRCGYPAYYNSKEAVCFFNLATAKI